MAVGVVVSVSVAEPVSVAVSVVASVAVVVSVSVAVSVSVSVFRSFVVAVARVEDFDVVVVVIVELLESSGVDVVFGAVVVVEAPSVDVTLVDTKDFVVVGGGAILVDLDVATFVVWGGSATVLGGAALVDLCLGGATFGGLGAGFGLALRNARSSGVEGS